MPHEKAPHPPGLPLNAYNARTQPNSIIKRGRGLSLTPELHAGLCAAVKTHPSLQTCAHSQGISLRLLQEWMRRGSLPGADERLVAFTTEFAAARAQHAEDKQRECDALLQEGNAAAASVVQRYIDKRFPEENPNLIEHAISGKSKRSDNIEELLLNPTPRLLGLLQKTGWVRRTGWNHAGVIATTGEPKADE